MKKQWKDHYWYTVPCVRARIEEIVKRAKGSYKVLDAGCNEGFLSQALMEAGFHVTSIDNNEKAIKKADEFFGIKAIDANVENLPFMDDEFDLVVAGELLEHLVNPGKGLSEIFRVAKNRVILSLPIGPYWLGCTEHVWEIQSTIIEHDHGHKSVIDKKINVLEFIKRR